MFSHNALKKANDIYGDIEYVMKFYKGKIKSKNVVFEESDREKEFDWAGNKTRCVGIYRPDIAK